MEILDKLFGSSARVKILKLFLLNTDEILEKSEVQKRAKVGSANATKELNLLEKISFLSKRSFFKEKTYKNGKVKKVRTKGYLLNKNFKFLLPLQGLLIKHSPMNAEEIASRINKHGKVKLVITAGVFIQEPDSRLDIMIVGDSMREKSIAKAISDMESEVGKSIKYAVFGLEDFKYRLGIYDKLVRDVLDYPHEVVIDKIGL